MATFFRQEAANLFVGEEAQGKHLTLMSIAMPELAMATQDHLPGGGKVGVSFDTHVQPLTAGFNLKGEDPGMLANFGLGSSKRQKYTVLGAVRNERTGELVTAKSILECVLGTINPDDYSLGELRGYEYGLTSITSYQVFFSGEEKWYWNYWTNERRVAGNDESREVNSVLQIGA